MNVHNICFIFIFQNIFDKNFGAKESEHGGGLEECEEDEKETHDDPDLNEVKSVWWRQVGFGWVEQIDYNQEYCD